MADRTAPDATADRVTLGTLEGRYIVAVDGAPVASFDNPIAAKRRATEEQARIYVAPATPEEAADRTVAAYAVGDRATAQVERAALAAFEPDHAPYGWVEAHLIGAEARRIAAAPTGGWGEPLILTMPTAQPRTEAEANNPACALATRMLALPADLYGQPFTGSTDPHYQERMAESRAIVALMWDAAALLLAGTVDDRSLRHMLAELCDAAGLDKAGETDAARQHWQAARQVAEKYGDAPALIEARKQAQERADRTGDGYTVARAVRSGAYLTYRDGEYETAIHSFGPIVALEAFTPQAATTPAATGSRPDIDRPRFLTLAALADAVTATADTLAADDEYQADQDMAADLYHIADAIRVTIGRPTVYDRAPAEALIASLTARRHEAEHVAAETAYRAAVLAE
jgi:hypothetical protein